MAKMQISIHKFCIVAHMLKNASETNFVSELKTETLELAILFNEFYFSNFKSIINKHAAKKEEPVPLDKIVKLAIKNNAQQKEVASITGKNKSIISRAFKKENNETQPATSN